MLGCMRQPLACPSTRSTRRQFSAREWWMPLRGVRLPAHARDLTHRAEALLMVAPEGAAISERSAAALYGVPLPASLELQTLHITVPPGGCHVDRPGVVSHRRHLPPEQVHHIVNVSLTSPERTWVDLGAVLTLPRLVAAGDYLLGQRLVTARRLDEVVGTSGKQRGIRSIRQALALLDPRAESPRESEMRVLLHLAGLPPAISNRIIRDDRGRFLGRGDLVYDEWKVVVEYDGEHHLSTQQQAKDADRRHGLALNGWFVVTVVSTDLRESQRLARKVTEALVLRGYRPARQRGRRVAVRR